MVVCQWANCTAWSVTKSLVAGGGVQAAEAEFDTNAVHRSGFRRDAGLAPGDPEFLGIAVRPGYLAGLRDIFQRGPLCKRRVPFGGDRLQGAARGIAPEGQVRDPVFGRYGQDQAVTGRGGVG